jgi:peroxiredoxin
MLQKPWTLLITFEDMISSSEGHMKTGSKLPSTPVQQLVDGEVQQIDLAARSIGKNMVLVMVPGAFTPTCSDQHVPEFLREAQAFRDAGVDEIIILATSDFFVVKAWSSQFDRPAIVQFMADGSQRFAHDAGQVLDLTALGLGLRSQRSAAVLRDGMVAWMATEPDATAVTITSAQAVLSQLQQQ